MNNAEDLMKRLAVSKKIMERHDQIKPGSIDNRRINTPPVEDFDTATPQYNIPQEYLAEQSIQKPSFDPTKPIDENRIMSSKLPDEIKRLMIEQPIVQPSSAGTSMISDEVIQGAQRLMGLGSTNTSNIPQDTLKEEKTQQNNYKSNINISEIKNVIRDVVRDTVRDVVREELKDAGMLVESTQNSNEVIQFKVGNHLFVGKVTKVKKLQN